MHSLKLLVSALPPDVTHLVRGYASPHCQPPIAAGVNFTIIRLADGTLRGFGCNRYGQLGLGEEGGRQEAHPSPTALPHIRGVRGVAAGLHHTMALMENGRVLAFGLNSLGQLGDGSTTNRCSPAPVPGIRNAQAVACGCYFTAVLTKGGRLHTFGANHHGQLGDGTTKQRHSAAQPLPDLRGASAVACGRYHTVVLMTDGTLRSCGNNSWGQLGDGSTVRRLIFTAVPNVRTAQAVACGFYHTVALLQDGTVCTCGFNGEGQLGGALGVQLSSFTLVPNVSRATGVTCLFNATFVMLEGGGVNIFCDTWHVELVERLNLRSVSGVFGYYTHSIVLHEDGSLEWNDCGIWSEGGEVNREALVKISALRCW